MKPITDIARALLPRFEACADCEHSPGWLIRHDVIGSNAVRCPCWLAWQAKVSEALKAAKDK